ncbi:MAG: hypothetical protein LBF83_01675 [Spirochaetaceae bacterium]|jgi:hypothetical protein|nr:hypothetical protein [Spirochaetaceae bacterium]
MKKIQFIGLPVLVLVFGLTLIGCDNGSTSKDVLDGTTWGSTATENFSGTDYTITGTMKFVSPDFELKLSYIPDPPEAFPTLTKGTYIVSGNNVTISPEGGGELKGTISGNKLTFIFEDGEPDVVYTKK